MKRFAFGLLAIFLFSSLLISVSRIRYVEAAGTIYIMPDGSIVPSSANITSLDNVTYTFTGDNYLPIVVNRSDIIIDGGGYMVRTIGNGFYLSHMSNVTIENSVITQCAQGIVLDSSSDNVVSGNIVTSINNGGINLDSSSDNVIFDNRVGDCYVGIELYSSCNNNVLFGNEVTANSNGIEIRFSCDNNLLFGNNIKASSGTGIVLDSSSGNRIFNNNLDNIRQVVSNSANIWDDGYPSGGNYWSDYLTRYSNATEIDDSGTWDTPYVINENNTDRYPLINRYPIPEFSPFLALPPLIMASLTAVLACRRKERRIRQ